MNSKDKAKKVDYDLQKDHGKSLWHFSASLAFDQYIFPFEDLRDHPGDIEFIKKLKKNAENNRNEILKRYPKLPQDPKLLKKYPNTPPFKFPNLSSYMYWIYRDIEALIKKINQTLNSQKGRGIPVKKINILAIAWSHFVKNQKAENYEVISLLKWFGKKLEKMDRYKVFCEEAKQIKGDQLRSLIYRHKNDDDHKKWIERYKGIFEGPGGDVVIYFNESIETTALDQLSCKKDTPLISFPDGDALTIGDFEENSEMVKSADKNRAHII